MGTMNNKGNHNPPLVIKIKCQKQNSAPQPPLH